MKCPFTSKQITCTDPDCSEDSCPIRKQHTLDENAVLAGKAREIQRQEATGSYDNSGVD